MAADLVPTGTCFDDAPFIAARLVQEKKADPAEIFVVQGLCKHPNGRPFAHAWVEYRGERYQLGYYKGEKVMAWGSPDEFAPVIECRRYAFLRLARCAARFPRLGVGPYWLGYRGYCRDATRADKARSKRLRAKKAGR